MWCDSYFGKICVDMPNSLGKYYYFIRLMGRKASHVALECALQSHPNMVILGEEVAASKLTIFDITKQICDVVQARVEKDKNHVVILFLRALWRIFLSYMLCFRKSMASMAKLFLLRISLLSFHHGHLHSEFLAPFIRKHIETEKLLAQLVETEMRRRLVLGHVCYHIIAAGLNGYMATMTDLKNPVNKWRCGATPISSMMTVKRWSCGPLATQIGKPDVHMASVDLKEKAYDVLRQNSSSFLLEDVYRNPGLLQFEGPGVDSNPISLCVEDQDYMSRIRQKSHLFILV
ncbi:Pyrophosphate--fructose 6-phosphate 1-phosphotransferase subunit beta 2 [Zea mays]|uniref:Pyrophosphate--fructose 6-phosphate 1-phosphotransferase subunit beta 2 n=1 Tax=Zea mays TaxID=4577 RepID=A0A1D6IBP1_MAIZE|nr:Pyrophosphate--fructose 6-phosphate 1-phosphotransferase subunit beta 2 [Zea mays]